MNLAHELEKIRANMPEADPGRVLSAAEIARVADTLTPLDKIPKERCQARVSVPDGRARSSYQQRVYR